MESDLFQSYLCFIVKQFVRIKTKDLDRLINNRLIAAVLQRAN